MVPSPVTAVPPASVDVAPAGRAVLSWNTMPSFPRAPIDFQVSVTTPAAEVALQAIRGRFVMAATIAAAMVVGVSVGEIPPLI